MSSNAHVPVLLGPVLEGLEIKQDGVYVDGTFGRGGHSYAILQRLGTDGRLLAIDRDPQAIEAADKALTEDPRFELQRGELEKLGRYIEEHGLTGKVDGLLFDLGVSSPQLDEARRGFSFLRDGPLDMRMDPESGVSAREWLEKVSERELKQVLQRYGEENQAGRIARAVVSHRDKQPIRRTTELADIVASVVPAHTRKTHPATKTFQAIRIFINRELQQLEAALMQSLDVLARGGRLCVISFHSLEDRIVKQRFVALARGCTCPPAFPHCVCGNRPVARIVTRKVVRPRQAEVDANPMARSTRLRAAEKIQMTEDR
mgnify:CR=1 FL=1